MKRPLLLLMTMALVLTALVLSPTRTADAQAADPAAPSVGLQFSTNADRSGAANLDGATVPADQGVAVFLDTMGADVHWAVFVVNGHIEKVEYSAPFDLRGTNGDGTAALAQFPAGDYAIDVWYGADGWFNVIHASFSAGDGIVVPPCSTIAEIAAGDPDNFSTLLFALDEATNAGGFDFNSAVTNPDADLTVFAPTNAAFAALDPAVLNAALADPAGLLTDVLAYHVLGTAQTGADLVNAGTATTLLGQDITATTDSNGNVVINDSLVIIPNLDACNGIVHVIDTVLIPAAAPEPEVISDGNVVLLRNIDRNKFLDADRWNVDLSSTPSADDEWTLEAVGDGTWRLFSETFGKYLDADGRNANYNVDLNRSGSAYGTEWEIVEQADGNYALRAVDLNRWLDADRRNVDTSSSIGHDDIWEITLAG